MPTNKLTDRAIKAFLSNHRKAGTHGAKLFDGGGLFLTITPAGSAIWRIKYRLNRKEKLYTVGAYPDVSLEGARVERGNVSELLRAGRDPVVARRVTKAATVQQDGTTFAMLAQDWLEKRKPTWSKTHYQKTKQALDRDIAPDIGPLPVTAITPAMVATAVERIVARGARETAAKALWSCRGIFELAQARGLCRDNPAIPARAILPRKARAAHLPAITAWPELGSILHRARLADITRVVHMAHRLTAFTAARLGNIVSAEWSEFDLDAEIPLWTVARAKMKARHDRSHDHKFVLCPQIVEELREWQRLTGKERYLFPSRVAKSRYIKLDSVEKVYRVTLGLRDRHTPHGWRASFSTLANDAGFPRDAVEIALDHVHDNEVVRAYDRGERLEQRVKLAKWWGDNLIAAERAAAAR